MKATIKATSIVFCALLLFSVNPVALKSQEKQPLELNLFYSKTCPHCRAELEFLKKIETEFPSLTIHKYVTSDPGSETKLSELAKIYGAERYLGLVPLTFVGQDFFVGFDNDENIGAQIRSSIERQLKGLVPSIPEPELKPKPAPLGIGRTLSVPFLGELDKSKYSLFSLAVILGFLDGFNICSLGALILILGLVITLRSRRKIATYGGIFILTTALVYGLLIFGWYKVFSFFSSSLNWLTFLIGLIGIAGGIYFLNQFRRVKKYGPTCEMAGTKLISIFSKKIEGLLGSQGRTFAMIAAIIAFAVVVAIVEFPCSAAVPVVFAGVLAGNHLPILSILGYLAVFLLFYLIDEIIVFSIAVSKLDLWLASPRFASKILLAEGIILLGLGGYYLLNLLF